MDIQIKLIEKIEKAESYINQFISADTKNGVLFHTSSYLDSYLLALNYMKDKVSNNEKIDSVHKSRWRNHMGGVHRYFEAHPLEELFYDISDELEKKYF